MGHLRAALVAAALACGLGATSAGAGVELTVDLAPLPAPKTWSDRGVDPALASGSDKVRVRIVLSSQPLLEAASGDRFQALAQPAGDPRAEAAAVASPGRITAPEERAARAAERSYQRAVATLDDESAQSSADLRHLAREVHGSGGKVLDREILPATLIVRAKADVLGELGQLDGVAAIEAAPVERPQSGIGTQAIGAPSWWAAGYTGGSGSNDTTPADAAVEGEAPDPTHPAFAGVTVDNSPVETVTDHGTHTAGIIASGDGTYPGVAYGIDKLIGADSSAYALGITNNGVPGAPDPAEVINLSFGSATADDNSDDGVDVETALFGISRAESAGNDNVDGAPTVSSVGRNTMSVAAYNDLGTLTSTDDVVLGDSSRGPSPGRRKKPDITAPGGAVIAPSLAWNTPPSNPDFTGMSGTSFSSPHVAGAMALLEGAAIGDPMAQRAILVNSARDWNGATTGLAGWSGPQARWRPEVGWGELDLTTALAQRADYQLGEVRGGEAAFYRATVPTGAKATLAYQMRGYFIGYPDPGTQVIKYTQTNLDLRQYTSPTSEVPPPADPGPGSGGPDAVDPNDTVEQVRAPSGGPQEITYKVEATTAVDGADAEPFAIAAAAPLESLETPVVRPSNVVRAPSGDVSCSTPVAISTELTNDSSDLGSEAATVGIELPAGVSLVSGAANQQVSGGTLEAGATSESHGWTVQASSDGPKTVTVVGFGSAYGTPFRRTQTVTITADCTPPSTSIDSGPDSLTNDPTPTLTFRAAGGGGGFQCSLDGSSFDPCGSPLTMSTLVDGPHTFRVRAVDAVGNIDPTPAERTFTVDTVAPETTISSGPEGAIASDRARFELAASGDASGFQCSLDASNFQSCGASYRSPRLADGPHVFTARAVDQAGNVDPTPAGRSFTVDLRAATAKLAGKQKQVFNGSLNVRLRARFGEAGRVRATGRVLFDNRKLTTRTAGARFAGRGSKKLALMARTGINRAIARALARDRRVRVRVRATFIDSVGNSRTAKRAVRLR